MINRTRRLLAVFLASSMMMGHGGAAVLAEGTTETAAIETVSENEVSAAAEEASAT